MVLLITCPTFISMHTSIAMKNKRKSQFLMEIIYNDEKRNSKTEFKLHDEDDGFFVKIKIKNRLPPSWPDDVNFKKFNVVDSCNGLRCLEDLLS